MTPTGTASRTRSCNTSSTTLFDTVAVYLAISQDLAQMKQLPHSHYGRRLHAGRGRHQEVNCASSGRAWTAMRAGWWKDSSSDCGFRIVDGGLAPQVNPNPQS